MQRLLKLWLWATTEKSISTHWSWVVEPLLVPIVQNAETSRSNKSKFVKELPYNLLTHSYADLTRGID